MATGFKFSPRCNAADPCCNTPDCSWFADDFERAASTALGDKWEEVAGDWEIDASGRLVVATSAARAKPHYDATGMGGWTAFGNISELYLRAVVSATAAGDEILIGNEYVFGGTTYRYTFGLRVGGAALCWFGEGDRSVIEFECPVTAAANTEHELVFDCGVVYLNGTAVCNLIGRIDPTRVGDLYVGTNDLTGELRVQELVIEKTFLIDEACPTCPNCPMFLGESPATLSVTVAGHTGDWAVLNGVYVLDLVQDWGRTTSVPCIYRINGLGLLWGGTDPVDYLEVSLQGGNSVGAAFHPDTLPGVEVTYVLNDATTLCAGSDPVVDYQASGNNGIDIDPGNTQAGATLTINL